LPSAIEQTTDTTQYNSYHFQLFLCAPSHVCSFDHDNAPFVDADARCCRNPLSFPRFNFSLVCGHCLSAEIDLRNAVEHPVLPLIIAKVQTIALLRQRKLDSMLRRHHADDVRQLRASCQTRTGSPASRLVCLAIPPARQARVAVVPTTLVFPQPGGVTIIPFLVYDITTHHADFRCYNAVTAFLAQTPILLFMQCQSRRLGVYLPTCCS
jgi:hypothetical protein